MPPYGPQTKNVFFRMSPMPRAVGLVMMAIGLVWLLQGVGVMNGSVMSGNALWAVLGLVVLAVGLFVLQRAINRAKAEIAEQVAQEKAATAQAADPDAPPPQE